MEGTPPIQKRGTGSVRGWRDPNSSNKMKKKVTTNVATESSTETTKYNVISRTRFCFFYCVIVPECEAAESEDLGHFMGNHGLNGDYVVPQWMS